MKRLLIILIFLSGSVYFCFAQNASESWLSLSNEEKTWLISGFKFGCDYCSEQIANLSMDKLPENIQINNESKDWLHFHLGYYSWLLEQENIKYWIASIDAFYLIKSNKDSFFVKAMRYVLDTYADSNK